MTTTNQNNSGQQQTSWWQKLLATASGENAIQVEVAIDTQSAMLLGIAILLAVTIGVFVGTKAAKL